MSLNMRVFTTSSLFFNIAFAPSMFQWECSYLSYSWIIQTFSFGAIFYRPVRGLIWNYMADIGYCHLFIAMLQVVHRVSVLAMPSNCTVGWRFISSNYYWPCGEPINHRRARAGNKPELGVGLAGWEQVSLSTADKSICLPRAQPIHRLLISHVKRCIMRLPLNGKLLRTPTSESAFSIAISGALLAQPIDITQFGLVDRSSPCECVAVLVLPWPSMAPHQLPGRRLAR